MMEPAFRPATRSTAGTVEWFNIQSPSRQAEKSSIDPSLIEVRPVGGCLPRAFTYQYYTHAQSS